MISVSVLGDIKIDLGEVRFSRSPFGYKSSEVDDFVDDLRRKLEKAMDERVELIDLVEKLRNENSLLQKERDSVTKAILNSEKIAQASVIDAGVKSKYILQDASEKAAKMVDVARSEYEKKMNEAMRLNDDMEAFSNECIQKLGKQIEMIRSFTRVPIKSLDLEQFKIDDVAEKFSLKDDSNQIFSDGASS